MSPQRSTAWASACSDELGHSPSTEHVAEDAAAEDSAEAEDCAALTDSECSFQSAESDEHDEQAVQDVAASSEGKSISASDLALWSDLRNCLYMRVRSPSTVFNLRFEQDSRAHTTSASSNEHERDEVGGRDPPRQGLQICMQGIDIIETGGKPITMPHCMALARLAQVPLDKVIPCFHQRTAEKRRDISCSGRSSHTKRQGVCRQLEVGPLDGSAPFLRTHVPVNSEAGLFAAVRGQMEELLGQPHKVDAKLQGWRVRCSPEVAAQYSLPMKRISECAKSTLNDARSAAIAAAAKAAGRTPPTPVPLKPVGLQVQMEDAIAEVFVPGFAGAGIRVRLPAQLEIESLESVLEAVPMSNG